MRGRHHLLTCRQLVVAIGCIYVAISSAVARQATSQVWAAESTTAIGITGNVTLTADKLQMAHQMFPLTLVRQIPKEHLANAGKVADWFGTPESARLFKTLVSGRAKLLNSNTICGANEDAKWVLAVYGKGDLSLAFFSGANEPDLDAKAVDTGHYLCGTYSYSAPGK